MNGVSIDQQLLAAQVALNNARNTPDILTELSLFGYDDARLNQGLQLLAQSETLVQQQRLEYGEQYAASATLQTAWGAANQAYMRSLKVARVAFKGHVKARTALMLDGRRKRTTSGWLEQARTFYHNLLNQPDLLAEMSTFGYDRSKVTAEADLVEGVAQANEAQEVEKGEAQAATQQRDTALDTLDDWLADFREIAAVALADQAQRLEQLGFSPVK